jgi:hypothetical protein
MKHLLFRAILLELIYLALSFGPDLRGRLLLFLALFLSAALAALFFAQRAGPHAALACGMIFRATLLFHRPDLSRDLLRYVWDGRVALSGVSPYAAPPESPRLKSLRDRDWEEMEHREALTIYPPAAQLLFEAGAATPRPALALRILFAAADLSIVALLLRFPGGEPAAALYAAFPLPVVESAGMGHLDSAGVALLLLSLLLVAGNRRAASGIALGASAMIKYFPLFALGTLLRRGRWALAFGMAATLGAFWALGSRGGSSPAAGLPNFATRWAGNSVVYPVVESAVEAADLPDRAKSVYATWKAKRPQRPWMEKVWPLFYPAFFARLILAVFLAIGLVVIAAGRRDLVGAVLASLGLVLLLSPVFHPWYALWVLPLAALRRKTSWIYLSAAGVLGYALLFPVPRLPAPAALAAEWLPFGVLLWREGL